MSSHKNDNPTPQNNHNKRPLRPSRCSKTMHNTLPHQPKPHNMEQRSLHLPPQPLPANRKPKPLAPKPANNNPRPLRGNSRRLSNSRSRPIKHDNNRRRHGNPSPGSINLNGNRLGSPIPLPQRPRRKTHLRPPLFTLPSRPFRRCAGAPAAGYEI